MKNIWIILCIVLLGCNNANNEKSMESSEMDDISVGSNVSAKDVYEKPNYNQIDIIEEKLQETYDLFYLSEKNSDFESMRKSSTLIIQNINLNNQNSPTVNNLHQIGTIETINDSTTHVNFSYILKQDNSEKIDTLKATIKKKAITIEGQTKTSIKIDFIKHDD